MAQLRGEYLHGMNEALASIQSPALQGEKVIFSKSVCISVSMCILSVLFVRESRQTNIKRIVLTNYYEQKT